MVDVNNDDKRKAYVEPEGLSVAADPVVQYMGLDQLKKNCDILEAQMRKAAKEQDYISAAGLRDEWQAMRKLFEERSAAEEPTSKA